MLQVQHISIVFESFKEESKSFKDLKHSIADHKFRTMLCNIFQSDYAMKYRAGIAPPRPRGPKRLTEYQKRFQWFDPVASSPLLAAEQVCIVTRHVTFPIFVGIPTF